MPKVAVIVIGTGVTAPSAASTRAISRCHKFLKNLGYDVDTHYLDRDSDYADDFADGTNGTDEYEFIVAPQIVAGFGPTAKVALLLGGKSLIPVFHYSIATGGTWTDTLLGADKKLDAVFTWGVVEGLEVAVATEATFKDVDSSNVTKIVSKRLAADPDTTGDMLAWSYKNPSYDSRVYAESSVGGSLFPFLLRAAIDNGDISAPPNKIKTYFDLDDFPADEATYTDADDCKWVVNKLVEYSIPCTIGIHAASMATEQTDDTVWDLIASSTVENGGPLYPIEHQGTVLWNETYASIKGWFETHNAAIRGHVTPAIACPDSSWGYHYFNTNRLGESGLRVLEEFDIGVARISGGISTTSSEPQIAVSDQIGRPVAIGRGRLLVTGLLGVENTVSNIANRYANEDGTGNPNSDDGTTASYKLLLNWLAGGMLYDAVYYIHGNNCAGIDGYDHSVTTNYCIGGWHIYMMNAIHSILGEDLHEHGHPGSLRSKYIA